MNYQFIQNRDEILLLLSVMEVLSKTESQLDNPANQFDKDDERFQLLNFYYRHETFTFNYKLFMEHIVLTMGPAFKNIIQGYEELIEKHATIPAGFFAEDEIKVKGKLLDTHETFIDFYRKASGYGVTYGTNQKIIHIDNNGFCTTGYDMQKNVSKNIFPIKSYLLLRDVEVPLPYKSLSNN